MWCFLLLSLFVTVQGRAVNISNTWVLPEEGFPVFYRYFRDRISWYEADAVCQFHHANLVTVDTTAQYDAVRAYLKELDISSAVWVGLIRSNPDGDFTWTDYRGLSGDGYWSSAPDTRSAPLCAAADPTADYRWEARACGGPSVASFICELPVPQWALGNEGCMLRALPALTVLYLPESASVQLTADCGLAGVKRVQCTGNMKREDLLRDLSCAVEDQTTTSLISSSTTFWPTVTDTIFSDQEFNNEISTEENGTTEHEDDIYQSISTKHVPFTDLIHETTEKNIQSQLTMTNQLNKVLLSKNINFEVVNNNNLQSNDIHNVVDFDTAPTKVQTNKLEDENIMQHKQLHDELARLGNFETIFNQPSDHFVPPLVMAKAKINDDMTALSIEEKLAQQLAERQFGRHNSVESDTTELKNDLKEHSSSATLKKIVATDNTLNSSLRLKSDTSNNRNADYVAPKKYLRNIDLKLKNLFKTSSLSQVNHINVSTTLSDATSTKQSISEKPFTFKNEQTVKDSPLELTVIIKDSVHRENNESTADDEIKLQDLTYSKYNISPVITDHRLVMNDEVIKIEITNEKGTDHSNVNITVFEVTTKGPKLQKSITDETNSYDQNENSSLVGKIFIESPSSTFHNKNITEHVNRTEESLIQITTGLHLKTNGSEFGSSEKNVVEGVFISNATFEDHIGTLNETESVYHLDQNNTNETPEIDDFNSPLLSAASEPLHRPTRSRRPQPMNRANKFNPFRILG